MKATGRVSRRDAMKAGAVCVAAMAAGPARASGMEDSDVEHHKETVMNPNVTPLAQNYVVVGQTPDVKTHYVHDPGMTRLNSGHLLVATCIRARNLKEHKDFTDLSLSIDGGRHWEALGTIPFSDATAIVHEGALYLMGQYRQGTDWLIMRSDDEGRTWTDPVTLFKGRYWNCQTNMVHRNGQLYWAMSDMHANGWYAHVAVACDLQRGLLDPAAWRMSKTVEPPYPELCSRNPKEKNWKGGMRRGGLSCLEPNVVQVAERVMVLSRAVIDNYSTANMGVVFDIHDEGGDLRLDFTQFSAIPGGQCKFFILYDKVTKLFFMLTNLVTDSQDALKIRPPNFHGDPGNERRLLFLFYARDALNWFPAGCVAKMPGMLQSFMYPSAVIDGDDIALISRTSKHGRNQHDADLCTFHRIRNFRELAMDLHPDGS